MILSSLGWADAPPQGFVPGPGYVLTGAQKASRYEDARTGSAVARYCPLWAWLHSHQPARFCFWELTKQLPKVVTHPGIAPASHLLNFGVPTNPKPVSSQKASPRYNCHTQDRLRRSVILSALGLATFSPARTVLFLGAHEATSQGGHPSWDCSSLPLA
ncbi:hypothetical protein L3X38_011331 [Prunus dulcis]|uniref:Uncharacterized protein n=1 Tax=Prunus dulcis TaxID=3755 RepID=A0AAD4WHC3_PRUDU|nr:hypothetical protein L3X38_011331 [Prunus dulcis]